MRIRALDGLRGLAALIVVFHHGMLSSRFGDVYFSTTASPQGSAGWWMFQTPFGVLFAGTQAVIIFFALSGFVLTGPALKVGFDWFAYSVRRFVRIWVPVAASVMLAALLILASDQKVVSGSSGWLELSSTPKFDWLDGISTLDLFYGSTHMNNPLWTMHWELLFSIALALFVVVGVALSRKGFLLGIIALTCIAAVGGSLNIGPLIYLPPFVGGVLLALAASKHNLKKFGTLAEFSLATLGFVLLGLLIFTRGLLGFSQFSDGAGILQSLWVPGSVLVVRSAITFELLSRLLSLKPMNWLGRISFSLYLVHVPVIVAFQHWFGHGTSLWALVLAFPACFLVAAVFHRWVEQPSVEFAKNVGSVSSAWVYNYFPARD